jgi:hypothetical protein
MKRKEEKKRKEKKRKEKKENLKHVQILLDHQFLFFALF